MGHIPTTHFLNEVAASTPVPEWTMYFYLGTAAALTALWFLGRIIVGAGTPPARHPRPSVALG